MTTLSAEQTKAAAIKTVFENSTPTDRQLIESALDRIISRGRTFTSENLIAELGADYDTLREPRLIGAIIQNAKRAKRIVPVYPVKGVRPKRHGAWVMLWEVVKKNG